MRGVRAHSTQQHWPFPAEKTETGYAYVLTHPGTPCIFYDDLWSHGDKLRELIALRKRADITARSNVEIRCADADMYLACIDNKCASLSLLPGLGKEVVLRSTCLCCTCALPYGEESASFRMASCLHPNLPRYGASPYCLLNRFSGGERAAEPKLCGAVCYAAHAGVGAGSAGLHMANIHGLYGPSHIALRA